MRPHIATIALLTAVLGSAASDSYAPQDSACPNHSIFRSADQGLNANEEAWIHHRDTVTQAAIRDWLENSDFEGADVNGFMDDQNPIRIGLAFSGGGFRAMLSGAGMLAALDSRVKGAMEKGGFGGLLQASSYITGLSGGSWLVGSVVTNNWTTVPELQASKALWNFQQPFAPSDDHTPLNLKWDLSVMKDINDKMAAHFPISITDLWGRLLSAQMFGGADDHGRDISWSSIASYEGIMNHSMPFPILISDGVSIKNLSIHESSLGGLPLNSTVYEMTPFEFGSWDPSISSFIDTKYLGTEMSDGDSTTNDCIVGYDNVGFLIATSSSIFNEILDTIVTGPLKALIDRILPTLNAYTEILDIALISPNPFRDADEVVEDVRKSPVLALADGGENGENIPLSPLLQRDRALDVIIAFDNSADTANNWPNGTSLINTYQRQFLVNSTSFPSHLTDTTTPNDIDNISPTFFGCSVAQYDGSDTMSPLIIYIPNSEKSFPSNQSTFKLNYSNRDRDQMIQNGYNVVTQNNGTLDAQWRTCAACAVVLRSQQRQNIQPTPQCASCFARFCYNGK